MGDREPLRIKKETVDRLSKSERRGEGLESKLRRVDGLESGLERRLEGYGVLVKKTY